MKRLALLLLSIILLLTEASSKPRVRVSCKGFGLRWIIKGAFMASDKKKDFNVRFYLATNDSEEPLKIDSDGGGGGGGASWQPLRTDHFDPSRKTYLVIHGYLSSGQKNWVVNIRDAILRTNEFNVIVVDWSEGCSSLNYVAAAKNTVRASYKIHMLLYELKAQMENSTSETNWSNIQIVGHSLGAHVAGQVSQWLNQGHDHFFNVEKITGLDPAGPCFTNTSVEARLDKDDANFVEVIHTQHSDFFSLGSSRPSGTIDFYVNGGADQPECRNGTFFTQLWNGRICSHKISYKYFLESFQPRECKFHGFPWDGTYDEAVKILEEVERGRKCDGWCPEMGHGSSKEAGYGRYLVFTSAAARYCHLKSDYDFKTVKSVIEELKEDPVAVDSAEY